jgi:endonuclease YncB( thermonuclease family)
MIARLLFAVVVVALAHPAWADDIVGVPKIRDGDLVVIGTTRIRLAGIDAPGLDQLCLDARGERWTCGIAARDALMARAGDKSWTCAPQRTDRFGRVVATCMAGGEDIQRWMVASGWAITFAAHSKQYEADEARAREEKSGLWAGAFVAPSEWQVRSAKAKVLGAHKPSPAAHPMLLASASGPVAPSPHCTIKGNINRAGACIYHKPNSRWYAKIKMRVARGARWFCSAEEAEAAGCRETRR